ncbi:kinesin-like protein KIF2C [Megalops cyprinoides]|uniref:kinesin-like protein KIF2C n=1 Tax=Megalops cyprinoides TaxID=118141 RepID=UPI00186505F9|nr:kinesin-like protein KIF2C [Megalops cyprinoides]
MDSSVVEVITIGLSVKISRSDGRIHAASVKTVHPMKGTVSVEWQENSITKGKEVDFMELWNLNKEHFEYLKSASQPNPKPETRLSSKIPAVPESAIGTPSEGSDPVSRKSAVRRTCLMQPGFSQSEPSTFEDGLSAEPPRPSIPRPGGSYAQRKKGLSRPTSFLPQVPEVSMDSGVTPSVSHAGPTVSSGRRKSEGRLEAEKMRNKREASQVKNEELRPKRGKENMNRPHWQFYKMIEEYRETLEQVPLSTSDPIEDHRICVCVRKRPLNKQEVARKEIDVVSVPGKGVLLLHEPKQKVDLTKYLENQLFKFDYSFDETTSNDIVYRFTAKPLVQTIFEGGMATCFAYGQTGSGKTHTMGGDFSGKNQNSSKGIYALAAQDVFALLSQRRYSSMGLDPYVTFFEIYNGKLFDLLNKKAKLRVLEDGKQQVQVVGLREMYVSSVKDVIKMIEMGSACRTSGQTFANSNSSRSHAVLQIILRQRNRLHGKFSLVDLAGNERGTDVSSNDRQTLVETAEINRSLLALKECIRSLGKNSEHIPFRMSKLTHVLRDSFIGENSKTCMIAMISPGMGSCDYTLNTLRYADRVKELNGASNGNDSDDKKMEIEEDEEDTVTPMTSMYEAVSQVSEMEDRVFEELQKASQFLKTMEQPTYDTVAVAAELVDYAKRLQESVQAFQSALESEELARMSPRQGHL